MTFGKRRSPSPIVFMFLQLGIFFRVFFFPVVMNWVYFIKNTNVLVFSPTYLGIEHQKMNLPMWSHKSSSKNMMNPILHGGRFVLSSEIDDLESLRKFELWLRLKCYLIFYNVCFLIDFSCKKSIGEIQNKTNSLDPFLIQKTLIL